MTDEEKKARRDRIEEAVEARSKVVPKKFRTYWLTRGRLNGELSGKVDIWLRAPDRILVEDGSGDVVWLALEDGEAEKTESAHYGRWTIAQARIEVREAVPATDRECVRVGEEPPVEVVVS